MAGLRLTPNSAGAVDVILSEIGSGKPTVSANGPHGVHDTLRNGLNSVAHDLAPRHPLQAHLATVISLGELTFIYNCVG